MKNRYPEPTPHPKKHLKTPRVTIGHIGIPPPLQKTTPKPYPTYHTTYSYNMTTPYQKTHKSGIKNKEKKPNKEISPSTRCRLQFCRRINW